MVLETLGKTTHRAVARASLNPRALPGLGAKGDAHGVQPL